MTIRTQPSINPDPQRVRVAIAFLRGRVPGEQVRYNSVIWIEESWSPMALVFSDGTSRLTEPTKQIRPHHAYWIALCPGDA